MNNDMRGLEVVAAKGRLLGLDMVYHCASGHLGGSFSAMDILTVLYFDVMRVDPKDPKDPDRDRFVLSKGHCTPALYPILAQRAISLRRSCRCSAAWRATCPATPRCTM